MSSESANQQNWTELQRYTISRLDSLEDQVTLLRIDIAMLKVRSSLWGAAAGMLPATIGVLAVIFVGSPV